MNGGTYLGITDAEFWFYRDPKSKSGKYWAIDGNYLYEGSSSIFGYVYMNNGTLTIHIYDCSWGDPAFLSDYIRN